MQCRRIANLIPAMLVVTIVAASASQCRGQDVAPPEVLPRLFGGMGIAYGQTARVNVANVRGVEDPNELPGTACEAVVSYDGPDTKPLAKPSQLLVYPGQIVFADLNRNSLVSSTNRVTLRIVVTLIGNPNIVPDPCLGTRVTVEIFDNVTGRTQVFIGDPNL